MDKFDALVLTSYDVQEFCHALIEAAPDVRACVIAKYLTPYQPERVQIKDADEYRKQLQETRITK